MCDHEVGDVSAPLLRLSHLDISRKAGFSHGVLDKNLLWPLSCRDYFNEGADTDFKFAENSLDKKKNNNSLIEKVGKKEIKYKLFEFGKSKENYSG